jgi:hypothetical protein
MSKLITDIFFDGLQIITEEKENKKDLFIEGIFMQAEKKNRNGRIYPIGVLKPVVEKYIQEYVSSSRAMGELNHPSSPSVNPERASHLITELRQAGNDFYGKAKILNTPIGNIVKGLIEGGVNLGVSSRGLGSLKEGTDNYRGSKVVQKDYFMVTVDIVSDPSAPDAFVNGVFESVDYIVKDGKIKEAKAIREKLHKANKVKNVSEAVKVRNAEEMLAFILSLE